MGHVAVKGNIDLCSGLKVNMSYKFGVLIIKGSIMTEYHIPYVTILTITVMKLFV